MRRFLNYFCYPLPTGVYVGGVGGVVIPVFERWLKSTPPPLPIQSRKSVCATDCGANQIIHLQRLISALVIQFQLCFTVTKKGLEGWGCDFH